MRRNFGTLGNRRFDLLVVGGGIFGACAARDAVLRGLSVALVEREDFGAGASASSFKIAHGGIRYLQHGDLARLRASCGERSAWLRTAPHLVAPLPVVVPCYGRGRRGRPLLGAGMLLYDLLTLDRNLGQRDPARRTPTTRFMGAAEVAGLFPEIETRDLTGAAVFRDAQIYNPPRLVLAVLRSAVDEGAVAVNHARVEHLIASGDAIVGARVRDVVGGETVDVRARVVLNAAGAWTPRLNAAAGAGKPGAHIPFSRDACFAWRSRGAQSCAIALEARTRDPEARFGRGARHLFLAPWRDRILCGVWHRVWRRHPDRVEVAPEELERFVAEINAAMPGLALASHDVTVCHAGLVPFGDNAPGAADLRFGRRSHVIDHEAYGTRNLVSLIGVRYTMGRADAACAVDLAAAKLGKRPFRPPTDHLSVFGGDGGRFGDLVEAVARAAPVALDGQAAEALARNHGSRHGALFDLIREAPALGRRLEGATTLEAEVVHAVREEAALTLADIVLRRTDLASGGHPGRAALERAAALAARELGWDAERRAAELAGIERSLAVPAARGRDADAPCERPALRVGA